MGNIDVAGVAPPMKQKRPETSISSSILEALWKSVMFAEKDLNPASDTERTTWCTIVPKDKIYLAVKPAARFSQPPIGLWYMNGYIQMRGALFVMCAFDHSNIIVICKNMHVDLHQIGIRTLWANFLDVMGLILNLFVISWSCSSGILIDFLLLCRLQKFI